MDNNLLNFKIFDEKFYHDNYLKFKEFKSKNELFQHWLLHGRHQDFCLNQEQLKKRHSLNIEHSNILLKNIKFKENSDIIFNILIRTSNRPDYFKKCIESIRKQNFSGEVRIHVCYDTLETFKYVKKYTDINLIFIENNKKYYSFNLYCNELLNEVKEGWIIFIDDDDMFITDDALNIISSRISNENDLIIWQFLRPDKIITPREKFKLGEIDTTCFCFHNNFKNKSKWVSDRCSDFTYFEKLDKKCNFHKIFLNLPLTRTIFTDKIAGYGINY